MPPEKVPVAREPPESPARRASRRSTDAPRRAAESARPVRARRAATRRLHRSSAMRCPGPLSRRPSELRQFAKPQMRDKLFNVRAVRILGKQRPCSSGCPGGWSPDCASINTGVAARPKTAQPAQSVARSSLASQLTSGGCQGRCRMTRNARRRKVRSAARRQFPAVQHWSASRAGRAARGDVEPYDHRAPARRPPTVGHPGPRRTEAARARVVRLRPYGDPRRGWPARGDGHRTAAVAGAVLVAGHGGHARRRAQVGRISCRPG